MISFEVKGKFASFKYPGVTVCVKTYPFITRTATLGLIGAMLGKPLPLEGDHALGVEIINPIFKQRFGMNLLGKHFLGTSKKGGSTMRRPTNVEVIVDPRYRIYYKGTLEEEIYEKIVNKKRIFPLYLGNTYYPARIFGARREKYVKVEEEENEINTVVPVFSIKSITGSAINLGNSGTMFFNHKTKNEHEGSISYIYNKQGEKINCIIDLDKINIYKTENKTVALI